jgi:hypothetical protein
VALQKTQVKPQFGLGSLPAAPDRYFLFCNTPPTAWGTVLK